MQNFTSKLSTTVQKTSPFISYYLRIIISGSLFSFQVQVAVFFNLFLNKFLLLIWYFFYPFGAAFIIIALTMEKRRRNLFLVVTAILITVTEDEDEYLLELLEQ